MHRKSRALFLIAAALLLLTAAFADTAKAQEAGTWEELEAALAKAGEARGAHALEALYLRRSSAEEKL